MGTIYQHYEGWTVEVLDDNDETPDGKRGVKYRKCGEEQTFIMAYADFFAPAVNNVPRFRKAEGVELRDPIPGEEN